MTIFLRTIKLIVAMGRCQSTPGLVETKGRTALEDMWLSSNVPPPSYSQHPSFRYFSKNSKKIEIAFLFLCFIL